MADVDKLVTLNTLADFYAPLLTENRREVIRLYCEEDLSLGEIAEQLGITRQGVSDALKKARCQLEDYEAKLELAARYRALGEKAQSCLDLLDGLNVEDADRDKLESAKQALKDILTER